MLLAHRLCPVKPTVINADIANLFLPTMPKRKSPRCDLLHKGPGRLALNLRNGPENLPTLVRSESRRPHRLRLDRHRRRRGPVRADLSHSDLISGEGAARDARLPWDECARAG